VIVEGTDAPCLHELRHHHEPAPARGPEILGLEDGDARPLVPDLDDHVPFALLWQDADDDEPEAHVLVGVGHQLGHHETSDVVIGDLQFAEPLGKVAAGMGGRTRCRRDL
jgi:hypothetical protein